MTLTVLISVYNGECPENLSRAMKSIWDDQTLKPDSIVLVQDGPMPDQLLAVIDAWKHKISDRIKVIVNEENLGLTKSLNRGVSVIDSDLIARMDSDDISLPLRFQMQVKYLTEHPDISIIGGDVQEFSSSNEYFGIRRYPLTHEAVLKYIYKASPLAHPAVMMRRSIFEKVSYDERFRTSQDIALWYDAICEGYRIANVPELLLLFRRDEDVYNRRSRGKAWHEFRIYWHGIHRVYGVFSFKYIFPIIRLVFRMMPLALVKLVYSSPVRTKALRTGSE